MMRPNIKTAAKWAALLTVGGAAAVVLWFIFLSVLIVALGNGNGLF